MGLVGCKEPSHCRRGLAVPPRCQRRLSTLLGEGKHAHTVAITGFGVTSVPTDVLPQGLEQGLLSVTSPWTPRGRRHRDAHLRIHRYSPGTARDTLGDSLSLARDARSLPWVWVTSQMALAHCPFLLCSLWGSSMSSSLQGQISTLLLPVLAGKSRCPSNPPAVWPNHPSF